MSWRDVGWWLCGFGSLWGGVALAAGSSPLERLPCSEAVTRQVSEWEPRPRWLVDPMSGDALVLRSPTSRIGVWLAVRSKGETVMAVRIAPQSTAIFSWSAPECQAQTSVAKMRAPAANTFHDATLRELVEKGGSGIIYAWSPHMPLSLKALEVLKRAARRLRLPIHLALDPGANADVARRVAARHGLADTALRRMESIELFQRGMSIHYPALLVFSKGKIRGGVIPGAKEEEIYLRLIKRELATK